MTRFWYSAADPPVLDKGFTVVMMISQIVKLLPTLLKIKDAVHNVSFWDAIESIVIDSTRDAVVSSHRA